ncbi:hypothetical protein [Bradyrhizobium shewense]|uniref:hypothetical protein n=1 Tax=Bradyrhizobium shewense TaxID=1761772 RepID=UPI001FDAB6D9|nr:hypothetical protein [Bradyrhizobium shewense]
MLMNGNAADTPFQVHDALLHAHTVDWQPNELSAQTGAPAHSSEDQESFEQQLNDLNLDDLDSVYPTSDSVSLAANSATATSSSAPNEVARETSRYPASSLVSARAQLAATLAGTTLEALRNEIDLAEQQAAHCHRRPQLPSIGTAYSTRWWGRHMSHCGVFRIRTMIASRTWKKT